MFQLISGPIIRPSPEKKMEVCLIMQLTYSVYIIFYVPVSARYDNSGGMVL